jgi:tRNA (cytidine/uridine-2'-O-)-methyltransferase
MFEIVLHQPEIPPNTGNVMRLAANTGARLHLIEPLGFELDDARLRRAGMDYRDRATYVVHPDLDACVRELPGRVFALARQGTVCYTDLRFQPGDAFVFGRESTGLPRTVLEARWVTAVLHIPMRPGVRSLNLANSVAVVLYEAWRQVGFTGAAPVPSGGVSP